MVVESHACMLALCIRVARTGRCENWPLQACRVADPAAVALSSVAQGIVAACGIALVPHVACFLQV